MGSFRLDPLLSVIFCLVTGNANVFLSAVQPWISLALSVVSFFSVCLIIIVNLKKIKNEKLLSGG